MIKEIISWIKVILSAVIIAVLVNTFVIVNAVVPTGSMENTVPKGAKLIGFRQAYLFNEPERGDVVVFKYPDNEEIIYLKRIIGLPNDQIEIKDGLVYINGSEEPLEETYLAEVPQGDFGPYEVPEGSYFMMGDNRNRSEDSRYWIHTYVDEEKILAKVIFMYWPEFKLLK